MVAIGGIADIVQHWHEMARSRMTQSGHLPCPIPSLSERRPASESDTLPIVFIASDPLGSGLGEPRTMHHIEAACLLAYFWIILRGPSLRSGHLRMTAEFIGGTAAKIPAGVP